MKILKEYRINDVLRLKLEKGRWDSEGYEIDYGKETHRIQIYVKDIPFRTCKYLLIINPQDDDRFEEIESIDDAKRLLNSDLETKITPQELNITPEEEFWAHCSNLQAWAENDYETRLLHSNLAFPLLRKLMKVGVAKARERYSEEVLERYAKGTPQIKYMLLQWDYFDYIPFEKQISIIEDQDEYDFIVLLNHLYYGEFQLGDFRVDNGLIDTLTLKKHPKLKEIPTEINNLTHLKKLVIDLPNIIHVPNSIGTLKCLKELRITAPNLLTLPESIGKLKSLKSLYISNANITALPESIGSLVDLEEIILEKCERFEMVPESIGKLKKLITLSINDTNLKELPNSVGRLDSLESLRINDSSLEKLPDSIGNLQCSVTIDNGMLESLPKSIGNMKTSWIQITRNKLKELPESFGNIKRLERLNLGNNCLNKLPESIGKLKELESLQVYGNQLESIPESIRNLRNLESLFLGRNNLKEFPMAILELENLRRLSIGRNQITSIPDEIYKLKKLEDLYLRKLSITKLSPYLRYKGEKEKPYLYFE